MDQFELPPCSVASEQRGAHGTVLGSSAGPQPRSGGPMAFQDAALEAAKCHLHHHPARNLSGFGGGGGEHRPRLSTRVSQSLELYFQATRVRKCGCGGPELPLAIPAAQGPLISVPVTPGGAGASSHRLRHVCWSRTARLSLLQTPKSGLPPLLYSRGRRRPPSWPEVTRPQEQRLGVSPSPRDSMHASGLQSRS